ncbi:MAG: amidohydrolase, partial [Saprospiraceae bacterium]|nr:amidohydrolase [Saprospiraceae bacterium]
MVKHFVWAFLLGASPIALVAQPTPAPAWSPNKQAVLKSVDAHEKDLVRLSDQVWAFAETALREHQSAKVLADYAEAQGFRVERGVAGMPTAFVASFGSGKPVIGILGEFDALPGLSQKAVPQQEPLQEGAGGHGCGHNMFGPGSLGAAIAIKELIQQGKLNGTIRFYGTPAEEAVGGKTYMARAGLFNDLDACLDWHPSDITEASVQSSQAMVSYFIEFRGKAAHAAYDPWNGYSALDAVELCLHGLNMLREHVKPSVRIHYVIKSGGDVPNVVPDYAKINLWVRDSERKGVEAIWPRVEQIAAGAAMMSGTEAKLTLESGSWELLVNRTGGAALQKNLELLGDILYTPAEIEFAKKIQAATGVEQAGLDAKIKPLRETMKDPEGGSTDVADVSWITPEISLVVTTAPLKAPWHSWAVVACGGMSIGHKGMLYSSKALGLTMVDLFE